MTCVSGRHCISHVEAALAVNERWVFGPIQKIWEEAVSLGVVSAVEGSLQEEGSDCPSDTGEKKIDDSMAGSASWGARR